MKACTLEVSSVPPVERLRVHLRSPCIPPLGLALLHVGRERNVQ